MTGEEINELVARPNAAFDQWKDTLPATVWAKKDLSACKLGFEVGFTLGGQLTTKADRATGIPSLRGECAQRGPCSDNGDGCICSDADLLARETLAKTPKPIAWQVWSAHLKIWTLQGYWAPGDASARPLYDQAALDAAVQRGRNEALEVLWRYQFGLMGTDAVPLLAEIATEIRGDGV